MQKHLVLPCLGFGFPHRSWLAGTIQAAWRLSDHSGFGALLVILHPPGCLTPSWPLGILLAPRVLLETRRPLATCCPPSCSTTSFLQSALQATGLPPKHSASSRQPIQRLPGHSASSWLPCALLVVRRHPECTTTSSLLDACTGRSMSSWLLSVGVPLAAQRTPGHSMHSRVFGTPWLLGSFSILRCLLVAKCHSGHSQVTGRHQVVRRVPSIG